jgi:hypothetical protein
MVVKSVQINVKSWDIWSIGTVQLPMTVGTLKKHTNVAIYISDLALPVVINGKKTSFIIHHIR